MQGNIMLGVALRRWISLIMTSFVDKRETTI